MLPVFMDLPVPLHAPWPVMHRIHATAPAHRAAHVTKKRPARTVHPAHIPTLSGSPAWDQGAWGRFPSWVSSLGRCIAHHESWTSGLWTAQNPVSSASGAFQFVDGTWRAWASRAGVSGYARAIQAPPSVQAYVFAYGAMHHGGIGAWAGTSCPGT